MTKFSTSKRQRSALGTGPPHPVGSGGGEDDDEPPTMLLFPFDMSLHKTNRVRLYDAMRKHAQQMHIDVDNGVILLRGGISRERDDTDHEDVFRQESFFAWTFGVKEPDFYGMIDLKTGQATLFMPTLPPSYAVFMGAIRTEESFKLEYQVDHVCHVEDLPSMVQGKTLYVLQGQNTDSGHFSTPATFPGIEKCRVDNGALFPIMVNLRAIKTEQEIRLLRHINRVSCEAHAWVMRQTCPGMMEFQQESMFQHFGYYFAQCRHTSYTSICGSGGNCAVLHYGHAGAPNAKQLQDGDMCLMDMGAEFHCYGSDVTCSFPCNGKFTAEQRIIYDTVLKAQWEVMRTLKPGVSYIDSQALAYRVICKELRDTAKILVGDLTEMEKANIGAVFMPHGLGHMLGIDTHDVGGKATMGSNIPRLDKHAQEMLTLDGFNRLRLTRPLEEGMVITVEPGVYFNDYVLGQALKDPSRAKFFNQDVLAKFRPVGGVRLEDDIVITKHGISNLTRAPRTIQDVERFMSGELDDLNACECPWSDKFE